MEFNFHHLPGQFDLNTKPFSFPFSKLWQFFTSGNSSGSCHGAGSTWWHGSFCRAGPELLSESLKGTWWKAPSSGATFECGTHRHEIIYVYIIYIYRYLISLSQYHIITIAVS